MSAPSIAPAELTALAGAARLFGDLLLREIDAPTLTGLREPAAAALLQSVGVAVPGAAAATPEGLDELASQFHSAFLAPGGGGAPPVASLWTEGRFEGAIAARVRVVAESAALDFGREAARGAPVDHLGVLLHLWAHCVERAPWAADEIASQMLGWSKAPLAQVQTQGTSEFYSSVAAAVSDLVGVLEKTRIEG